MKKNKPTYLKMVNRATGSFHQVAAFTAYGDAATCWGVLDAQKEPWNQYYLAEKKGKTIDFEPYQFPVAA